MAKDKKPRIEIYLPKGIAVHPAIRKPDTKYDELGIYKAPVRVPAAEAKETIAKLQEIAKGHLGKPLQVKKNPCWEYEVDPETGEETGFVLFKNKARNKTGRDGKLWDRRPAVFDAKRKLAPVTIDPWSGTEYRVKCEVYLSQDKEGKKSMSLQPLAVQILNLVTGSPGDRPIDVSGFDEYEDGFEADEAPDFGDPDDSPTVDDDDVNY